MALKGEHLARPTYSVIQTVHEGNTGVCYRAYHEIFGCDVAQKTISLLGMEDALAHSEPRLLKNFRHDHLVEVWEAQWEADEKWRGLEAVTFVMPFHSGGSIANALIEGHSFSLGQSIGLAVHVLDALQYLHVSNRVLHRDVKPGNVMLDATRTTAFLGDLGSAARMTQHGDTEARGGTPLYRPPESAAGRYTVAGDLYGLGMVLFELVNGRFPYEVLDRDDVEIRLARGKAPVPARLLRSRPHVPQALRQVIGHLTSIDPSRRPSSALAAQRALGRIKHMDWRFATDGDGPVWFGRWPPSADADRARVYQIRESPLMSGRFSGQLALTSRWRDAGSLTWRRFRSLDRRVSPDDAIARSRFFRDVESAAAQTAAARQTASRSL